MKKKGQINEAKSRELYTVYESLKKCIIIYKHITGGLAPHTRTYPYTVTSMYGKWLLWWHSTTLALCLL